MSGIASGIGKIFTTVTSAVSRVGSAVAGVGTSLFTAGASSGGIAAAAGGGGILANILTGAVTQAGIGALLGGAIGAATGQGFGKGALIGAAGGAISGGLMGGMSAGQVGGSVPGNTATGFTPTGVTADPVAASGGGGGGFMKFLGSEAGGSLIAGAGQGISSYMQQKGMEDEAQKDRDFKTDAQTRITDSYRVDPSVYQQAPTMPASQFPTPAQAYTRMRNEYNPQLGRIVKVPA